MAEAPDRRNARFPRWPRPLALGGASGGHGGPPARLAVGGRAAGLAPGVHSVDDLLRPQREALAQLLRSDVLGGDDVQRAIREVTEVAARTLNVGRVGVWRLEAEPGLSRPSLVLVDLYEKRDQRHSAGLRLRASEAPRYFEAVMLERSIAAHDAPTDPRTSELTTAYLDPQGIRSLLDAPILVRGQIRGVICHEHAGVSRTWSAWEELVAATFADFIAMIYAAQELLESRRQLEEYQRQLQGLVEERTARLRERENDVRHLFEASPVALVLTNPGDQTIIDANLRASELFCIPVDEVKGQPVVRDFWVNDADRDALLERLARVGLVPSYEARLQRADGTSFWADISAQLVPVAGSTGALVGIRDITNNKNAELALQAGQDTLRTLFHAAPVPLVLTSLKDAVLHYANARAATMFETTPDEIIGRRAPDFHEDPDDRQEFLDRLVKHGRVDGFVTRLRTLKGRPFWALLNAARFELDGEPVFMVGFQDLTEQKAVEERLRELATIDPLTGVANRRHFFETAETEVQRADRYGGELSLAMIDADHFKAVNDRYGHSTGDAALQHIAGAFKRGLRRSDTVGRYGGEELAVLLPGTDLLSATRVVDDLRAQIAAEPLRALVGGARVDVTLTVSAGVVARRPGETLQSMLQRADEALYGAKAGGRNLVITA